MTKKKSFFERLTGSMHMEEEEEIEENNSLNHSRTINLSSKNNLEAREKNWEEETDAELTIDLYQTQTEIIVQTMVAGVQPDNLSITITRDIITIRGKREENKSINSENYFVQELYWGSFSRTISLPEEVDPEEAEAIEKHGLLIIRLPKINKDKETKLKVKSI
jgi:HSP20 family protein